MVQHSSTEMLTSILLAVLAATIYLEQIGPGERGAEYGMFTSGPKDFSFYRSVNIVVM